MKKKKAHIFMVSYGILRIYEGGYHADTQIGCYLFSIAMMILVLLGLAYIPINGLPSFIITALSSIIIFCFAPIEDKNKPLSQLEQVVFKERTNIILIMLIGMIVLFWFIGLNEVSMCMSVALFALSWMLILGGIKNFILLIRNNNKSH